MAEITPCEVAQIVGETIASLSLQAVRPTFIQVGVLDDRIYLATAGGGFFKLSVTHAQPATFFPTETKHD